MDDPAQCIREILEEEIQRSVPYVPQGRSYWKRAEEIIAPLLDAWRPEWPRVLLANATIGWYAGQVAYEGEIELSAVDKSGLSIEIGTTQEDPDCDGRDTIFLLYKEARDDQWKETEIVPDNVSETADRLLRKMRECELEWSSRQCSRTSP